jgi:NAD(P) transhydrogenase subunit alpha
MFETEALIISLTVFVLAIFIGYEVITKVPPTLHTPLMSGSNAISGIVIVGALLVAGQAQGLTGQILGTVAVGLAMINVVGGFLVTDRMLKMFRRSDEDRS